MDRNRLALACGVRAGCALLVACLAPIAGVAQSSPTPDPAAGAARVLAPAAAVVGARKAAATAKPQKQATVAKVVGMLRDAATGESLVGGQVGVRGLTLGNISDDTGAYFINNVPLGKRTFTVEYLGYESQAREHEVKVGGPNTVDFSLTATPIEMAEVVVEEEVVADLTDYVEKVPPPTFKPAPIRDIPIVKPDTTLMEKWHRSMRFVEVKSIEYPMSQTKVYYRSPEKKRRPPSSILASDPSEEDEDDEDDEEGSSAAGGPAKATSVAPPAPAASALAPKKSTPVGNPGRMEPAFSRAPALEPAGAPATRRVQPAVAAPARQKKPVRVGTAGKMKPAFSEDSNGVPTGAVGKMPPAFGSDAPDEDEADVSEEEPLR